MKPCVRVPELSPNPQFILFHSPFGGFYIIVRVDVEDASLKIEAGRGKKNPKTGKERAAKRVVISRSSGRPCIYVSLSVGLK